MSVKVITIRGENKQSKQTNYSLRPLLYTAIYKDFY